MIKLVFFFFLSLDSNHGETGKSEYRGSVTRNLVPEQPPKSEEN
jgi:hypothetical protein